MPNPACDGLIEEQGPAFTWPELEEFVAILDAQTARLLREECHAMRPWEVGAHFARRKL